MASKAAQTSEPVSYPTVLTAAGAVYVTAWSAGLLAAPAPPSADAPGAEIARFYAENASAAAGHALLVHGVAGVALVAIAFALARIYVDHASVIRFAGAAAGVVSLVQCGLGLAAARGTSVASVDTLYDVLNRADGVKLLLLVPLVVAVTASASHQTRWLHTLGQVLAPGLVVAGIGLAASFQTLFAVLFVLLPALLVWMGATAWQAGHRPGTGHEALA